MQTVIRPTAHTHPFKTIHRITLAAALSLGIAATGVTGMNAAADWPGFLGPNRDAVADAEGLAKVWPENGPPAMWTVETGSGFGGAAIVDDQVFLLDRLEESGDALRVFDLRTGEELWRFEYEAPGRLSYHGSRSTPTVAEDYVYTIGGFSDLHCISRETHESVWHINLEQRFGAAQPRWGYAQSPLVVGDLVVVSPVSGRSAALVAFNRSTGELVWESEVASGSPAGMDKDYSSDYYSSPALRTVAGVEGIMHITNHQVSFVNPTNGAMIWKYNGYAIRFSIPLPTVVPGENERHNGLFVTGGYDDGSVFIDVRRDEAGEYQITERWRWEGDGCQIHAAVYHEGYLYANINENSKLQTRRSRQQGGLACIDPSTGEIVWRTGDSPSFDRGGLISTGDQVIVMEGQTGELYLVEMQPSGFEAVSSFAAMPQERRGDNNIWAPLALSDGILVVRDQMKMRAFDIREGRRAAAE